MPIGSEMMGDETSHMTSPATSRVSSLLRSKLRPPAAPDYFIPRPRLNQLLDQLASYPLTLVVAPAGSGKSQLVSNWVHETDLRTAWLSLEETDDDPAEFWLGISTALEELLPTCSLTVHDLLARGAPASDVVRSLLESLEAASTEHCMLILDDVHVLRSAVTTESLALFVQHLPVWLHVMLLDRRDPLLPLDRLRVRGQLAELRFAELRFAPSEARLLLVRLAPDLTDTELEEAVVHTDGWAAGVQLIGLAARSARARDGTFRRLSRAPVADGRLRLARGAHSRRPRGHRGAAPDIGCRSGQHRVSRSRSPAILTLARCCFGVRRKDFSSTGSVQMAGSACTRWCVTHCWVS